ncbi:ADP-ribosyl-[dinitrogen reductase] glycohydrolase [bioreactor metagenome]|uniref:ADP-ribosyl-[dinitrogen reductase] glycohydrolase n=1 Tax=bioreactor metagenome TaxID=1076179 RepID=A0A644UVA8_9ZZZZ|nr:ADP-ribosylglycohydrolase family protein [Methanocorpusculum sp.]
MNELRERIIGGLFGCAAGDALGASYEGTCGDENRKVCMSGGGQFSLKKGEVTDDTLMTLALAETYCETGAFDRTVFLRKLILTLRDDASAFGGTTRTLASLLEQGCTPHKAAYAVHTARGSRTNGSVMRTIPIGLVMEEGVEETARIVSAYTHYDKDAGDCCAVVAKAAAGLTAGRSKTEVLKEIPAIYLSGELVPSVDPVETTKCALACFRDATTYADVVCRACILGGDTDTIACIAGGLAGILWGVPQTWIDSLLLKDRIVQTADNLCRKIEERQRH